MQQEELWRALLLEHVQERKWLMTRFSGKKWRWTSGDAGWACGYRNLQLLWSAIQLPLETLPTEVAAECLVETTPSIATFQRLIQWAWSKGFDREGAAQLGGVLEGTQTWIGTSEVATLLRALGRRAAIVGFDIGQTASGMAMVAWVLKYFGVSCDEKDYGMRCVR